MLVMLILHFVCFPQVGPQLALARRRLGTWDYIQIVLICLNSSKPARIISYKLAAS